jgi:hypothetical protein
VGLTTPHQKRIVTKPSDEPRFWGRIVKEAKDHSGLYSQGRRSRINVCLYWMRRSGRVARMGEMRNSYNLTREGERPLGYLGTDRRIILKDILQK